MPTRGKKSEKQSNCKATPNSSHCSTLFSAHLSLTAQSVSSAPASSITCAEPQISPSSGRHGPSCFSFFDYFHGRPKPKGFPFGGTSTAGFRSALGSSRIEPSGVNQVALLWSSQIPRLDSSFMNHIPAATLIHLSGATCLSAGGGVPLHPPTEMEKCRPWMVTFSRSSLRPASKRPSSLGSNSC